MSFLRVLTIVMLAVMLQVLVASTAMAAPAEQTYSAGYYHVVHTGETLFSIGRHYDVFPYAIADANGLPNPDLIYAGQVLFIPPGPAYAPRPERPVYTPPYHEESSYDYGHGYNYQYGYGHNQDYGYGPSHGPSYNYGYGYDQAGYYYDSYYPGQQYQRYSYTCGYNYNCY